MQSFLFPQFESQLSTKVQLPTGMGTNALYRPYSEGFDIKQVRIVSEQRWLVHHLEC